MDEATADAPSTGEAAAGEPAAAEGAAGEGAAGEAASAPAVAEDAPATAEDAPSETHAGDQSRLEKQIQKVLKKDPDLKNNDIVVSVNNCHVYFTLDHCNVSLTGTVDNQGERMKAEQVARIKGVVLVDNLLDLGADVQEGIADGAVTAKVREQLFADKRFKTSIISISTSNGVVTLVGTAPSQALAHQAGELARKSRAVRQVNNQLQIEPSPHLPEPAPPRPIAIASPN